LALQGLPISKAPTAGFICSMPSTLSSRLRSATAAASAAFRWVPGGHAASVVPGVCAGLAAAKANIAKASARRMSVLWIMAFP
jgi:hypothetical protein